MSYYPDGNPAENGLLITPQMIEESNLDGLGHEVHTMDGAIAIISDEMEALELIHTADMLKAICDAVSIPTVADNLVDSVKYKVEEFTGMPVEKIDVLVEGVRVID